ncbi:MAG: antibiotic biosynthesis monooxygenase [Arachidicoccus sp.]|nr:antibiotic biosynthesis monooxygenase [Arachidicoccus sp.]
MITKALLAKLKAKPGKEEDVEVFLKSALPLVQAESGTIHWFAIQFEPGTYGIFDTFETETARITHLSGEVAKALMAKAPDLFAVAPDIVILDVFAQK